MEHLEQPLFLFESGVFCKSPEWLEVVSSSIEFDSTREAVIEYGYEQ